MKKMAELQTQFLDQILQPDLPVNDAGNPLQGIIDERYIARLEIYQNNVTTSTTHYLRDVFPVLEKLVGWAFFEALCQRFLTQHPPEQGDIHLYGQGMADFVDQFEPLADLPYLGDVTRLEWHHHRAYYALQHPPLDLSVGQSQLLACSPALNDSVTVFRSAYPVDSIWQQAGDNVEEFSVDVNSGPVNILVFRFQQQVIVWNLNEAAVQFLTLIKSGKSLGEAIEQTMTINGSEQLPEFLSQCLQQAILCQGQPN